MKKVLTLIFIVLMILNVSACGSQNGGETDNQSSGISPSSNENSDNSSSFDTSWASNDFEALIPKLPFDGWTTNQKDELTYEMELIGLNTSGATNPPDSGEPDGADKQKLINYLNSLTSCGFTVEETGEDYEWVAVDGFGNEIEFMCADGGCWITINKID